MWSFFNKTDLKHLNNHIKIDRQIKVNTIRWYLGLNVKEKIYLKQMKCDRYDWIKKTIMFAYQRH